MPTANSFSKLPARFCVFPTAFDIVISQDRRSWWNVFTRYFQKLKDSTALRVTLLAVPLAAMILGLLALVGHWDEEEVNKPPPAGMAKVEVQDNVQVQIPGFAACPGALVNMGMHSYCVPAGDTIAEVVYGDTWAETEKPVRIPIHFASGHRYRFKAANEGFIVFWVEDAADGSVVAGVRPSK